jgi:hypothetical protein
MPNADYTHIILIVDRSGSMSAIRDDTIGGINEFVAKQQRAPGKCTSTMVQFDTEYEVLYSLVDINEVEPRDINNYVPRGGTALFDAVGRAVVTEGEKLAAMDEADRPGLVVLNIVTDGYENSSQEYSADRIRQMLTEQQEQWRWQVMYLGANQDAFAVAGNIGINVANAANFAPSGQGIRNAYGASSNAVLRARGATSRGDSPSVVGAKLAYTPKERKDMDSSDSS